MAGLQGTYGRLKSKVVGSVVEKRLEERNRTQESHEQNTEATAAGCWDWLDEFLLRHVHQDSMRVCSVPC